MVKEEPAPSTTTTKDKTKATLESVGIELKIKQTLTCKVTENKTDTVA